MQEVQIFEDIAKPFIPAAGSPADEFAELEQQMTLQDLQARIAICRKVGLTVLQKTLTELFTAHALKALIPYPFLSREEERTLAAIFPTRYKQHLSEQDRWMGYRLLASYTYDLVPPLALAEWGECVDRQLFATYEIWTAEKLKKPDPVLLGRRDDHDFPYVIARWADALRPLDELAKEARVVVPVRRSL